MRTLKLIAFLIGSAILTLSCDEEGHKNLPPNTLAPVASLAPAIPVKAPKMIIDVQEAEDMYHNYKTELIPTIDKALNSTRKPTDTTVIQATTSISFEYTELKKYLAFIEQEAKSANTPITSLRVYLSKYANSKNEGRSTVFLNPTMAYGSSGITDDVSFAIQTKGKTKVAVPVGKCYKTPTTSLTKNEVTPENKEVIQTTGIQSLAGNRGGWRPPPENDNDDFQ